MLPHQFSEPATTSCQKSASHDTLPPDNTIPLSSPEDLIACRDKVVAEAITDLEAGRVERARDTFRRLELTTIDQNLLDETDMFLPQFAAGRKVVASFDCHRLPASDELVIIYGNYPHIFANLVVNNPVKRHVADFWRFGHDVVEHDPRWDAVDRIFIINADKRCDRYDAVLRELASARVPLDRVTRVPAHMLSPSGSQEAGTPAHLTDPQVRGHIGCLRSHIEVLRRAQAAHLRHVLVLEDDFCFTSDLEAHLTDLEAFFERNYDYWICLVATSKNGAIVPKDDLLSLSFQRCTNTGGYLISQEGVKRLLPVFERAVEDLAATGDCRVNAVDRCWGLLQPSGRFFVFRRKFGFQVSSYSDIERSISRYLD
jgi:GR25 family glycosyltransferase involved in LPS biosynthesis